MNVDMTNNRVPYGLLSDEEKAALHEHKGEFEHWCAGDWINSGGAVAFYSNVIYRTVPLPKTQDVIAWDRLPAWVEWVARDADGDVWAYDEEPECDGDEYRGNGWMFESSSLRIDDWPGIVQIGTVDWQDSKQRRPRG
jgi:hypothetical protein